MGSMFRFEVVVTVLISFGAYANILLSKWRFLCWLSGHIGGPSQFYILLNLEWLSYLEHVVQSLLDTCVFFVSSIVGVTCNHIPLESRCLMKRSNRSRHVYLVGSFQRWTPWAAMDKLTWCAEPISPHDKLLGSRYSQSWLKRNGSLGYPTRIGWSIGAPHFKW